MTVTEVEREFARNCDYSPRNSLPHGKNYPSIVSRTQEFDNLKNHEPLHSDKMFSHLCMSDTRTTVVQLSVNFGPKMLLHVAFTLFLAVLTVCSGAKVYIVDDKALQKASSHIRVRRQTHPAATIAKLPTQDSGAFVPIAGPTQSLAPQFPSFPQNDFFTNTIDFPSLQSVPNTLVDYLVPPSPDSQVTSLNFQDPAANLQNIDNASDVTSPTSSPSSNFNTFQPFQNAFPPSANFQNSNNQNQPSSTTQSTFTNDQVQSISFQNPPLASSPTPSLAPTPPPSTSANNFFSNKISNPLNREAPPHLNSVNQFLPQFNIPVPPPANVPKSEALQEKPAQQANQAKWELGFDANEILAPPREESFGRANDYDTINVAKFRRPSSNLSPPTGNAEPPISQIQPPASQFFNQFAPPNFQFAPFNQFPSALNAPTNDPFIPVTNQFTPPNNQISANQFAPSKESNDPNIVWGTQKQANFNPTTNAPFLPTIPPNTNSNGQQPFQNTPPQQPFQSSPPSSFQNGPQQSFQNGPQPSFQNAQQTPNFQNNGFNPVPPPQQLQFQHPPQANQQLFDLQNLNQNFPIDTPLTSQFDSFLPQGTVSDHSFQLFNENGRHFQKKRQVSEEEVDEQQYEQQHPQYDDEPESKFRLKHAGPVYSFVKTDRDGHFKWSVRHPSKR